MGLKLEWWLVWKCYMTALHTWIHTWAAPPLITSYDLLLRSTPSYSWNPEHPKFKNQRLDVVTAETKRNIKKFMTPHGPLSPPRSLITPPHCEPMSPLPFAAGGQSWCCNELLFVWLQAVADETWCCHSHFMATAPLALNHHLSLSPAHVWSKATSATE